MTGPNAQKRRREEAAKRKATGPPRKKIKKQRAYHSSSEEESDAGAAPSPRKQTQAPDFKAVNLLDSDDDSKAIHAAAADDGASSAAEHPSDKDDGAWSDEDAENGDEPDLQGASDSGSDDEEDEGPFFKGAGKNTKSKRNDPTAFSTSITKILGTKLSSNRKTDPVLSRSADAAQAARDVADSALEVKARRRIREQKRQAKEKGRVKDVLVGTIDAETGEQEVDTSVILADERRLKKTATRGVVKMFNAIRQAQVGAADADRQNKKEGIIGQVSKKERVTDMSKEAFLDLIAKGGGSLSKKPLEEA